MNIYDELLKTAYGKADDEREEYLLDVLATILGTIKSVTDTLPPEAQSMPPQCQHILSMLILNKGRVVSTRSISEYLGSVYDKQTGPKRNGVRVQISRIRQTVPDSVLVIENVWGLGYRLKMAAAS